MADSILTYLDKYCERAGEAGMFAEPLNLFTNLFFIAAAALAGRALMLTSGQGRRMDLWLLTAIMLLIGSGSGLWHLVPTRTTLLMDVIPITLFINLYIISSFRRLFCLSWPVVAAWWGLYTLVGLAAQKILPPDLLNGSIMYMPTYMALLVMTITLAARKHMAARPFALSLIVWTASLALRTIDMELCSLISAGTHFLWHTLNAWVLWRLLMVLVLVRR